MPPSGFQHWARSSLYRGLLALALGFALLVIVTPFLAVAPSPTLFSRLWHLFAEDATLRRTTVIAAFGLWTTAVVFFGTRPAPFLSNRPLTGEPHA